MYGILLTARYWLGKDILSRCRDLSSRPHAAGGAALVFPPYCGDWVATTLLVATAFRPTGATAVCMWTERGRGTAIVGSAEGKIGRAGGSSLHAEEDNRCAISKY